MKRLACVFALIVAAVPASGQTPERRERGWLDVSLGIAAAAEDSLDVSTSFPLYSETASFGTSYSWPRGAEFDFGGGYMFTGVIGLGVSFVGTAHEDTAELSARIPHPLRFNAYASDATVTNGVLKRVEGVANVQLMVKVPVASDRVRVRFFAGPSYFQLKGDYVNDIVYEQSISSSVQGISSTSRATRLKRSNPLRGGSTAVLISP